MLVNRQPLNWFSNFELWPCQRWHCACVSGVRCLHELSTHHSCSITYALLLAIMWPSVRVKWCTPSVSLSVSRTFSLLEIEELYKLQIWREIWRWTRVTGGANQRSNCQSLSRLLGTVASPRGGNWGQLPPQPSPDSILRSSKIRREIFRGGGGV